VKLRIEGLPGEVDALAGVLRGVLEVVEESRDYPNRAPSTAVRRYLEVRPPTPPTMPRPNRITRPRRLP
jgi:hypothetical protein